MIHGDAEKGAPASEHDPFAQSALARVVPATEAQREIWLAAKLAPEASLAYNEAVTLRLRGPLNAAALRAALNKVVAVHDALRATFSPDGTEMLIAERMEAQWREDDLAVLDTADRDAAIEAVLKSAVETPFDLEHGPLLRAELLRLGADDHLLVLSAHHIVCDGWSWGVIVHDLGLAYGEAHDGSTSLPAMGESFADMAQEEVAYARSDAYHDTERYWVARFTPLPAPLDLPVDRPRPRTRGFASSRCDLTLDPALLKTLTQIAAQRGASLYAILMSAFAVFLHRLSGQDDLVIGIPAAGQAVGGHHGLVGHAVNILPLRVGIDGNEAFAEALVRMRGELLDAFEHPRYTFGSLLKRLSLARDPSRLPLVNVLFNLDRALGPQQAAFPRLAFELASVPRTYENFEIFVNAAQRIDGGLNLECQFSSALFDTGTIEAWLDAYATLLRGVVENSAASVGRLPLLSPEAITHLDDFQPPRTPYEANRLAHEYFELQADRAPARAAVRFGAERLSYAQLEARANRLAHVLRARAAVPGTLVGIALARGVDMLASVLAVLKTGAGYVPLDPSFPADRLAFMIGDAGLSALIVDDEAPPTFPAAQVLSLTRDADAIAAAVPARLRDGVATPDSVAYVIYTSGSTGRPKGVRVPHRATSNFLTAMQRVLGIAEDDRLVAVTTLSFDIAFLELMLPLSVGAEIIIASRDEVQDGGALRRLVESSEATVFQATPGGWRILIGAGWPGRIGFKGICGGEPLPPDLAESLLERCGEVWNMYGPTEATVWSTYWRVTRPREGIFIGRPIANTSVHILDELRAPCPIGVSGEMYIGGAGVALGYLNRPDLDTERFLPDPFSTEPGARMYRTGDRGRWCANGSLEHLGRLDFQVKVRGYRIELGEIEATLADRHDVARVIVMARADRPGDVRLVAYVVPAEGAAFDEAALRVHLKQRLPDYMLPQHFVVLEAIPLLPNGKLDRNALPRPSPVLADSGDARVAPRNDIERRIAAAMEQALSLPGLGIHDDFFALGGHSLLAAQLTAQLNRDFGITLSFRTLFDAPTIEGLAIAIEQQISSGEVAKPESIPRLADQSRAPASLMQQRLWFLEEMNPGRIAYNTPSAHRLLGHLDEQALERAFAAMVKRQAVLRTSIRREGDQVVQIVEPSIEVKLFPAEDLSGLPAAERQSALMQRMQVLTDTPFDLTKAPLFRARMFKLDADDHAFFFMPHHIIWDGWSFDLLYADLSGLYRAFKSGQPPVLPELPVSYCDFAAWHAGWLEGPQLQKQLRFWRERLAQTGEPQSLTTDKPRRPGMSGVGRTEWVKVSKQQTDAMHEVARIGDATLNMGLLALYYVLLYVTSGQRELVVGTPVRGRNQTEVESVMGYFTNLVPLHLTVNPEVPFVDFIREVKRVVVESFGNPDVPLEYLQGELRARYGGSALLYQALFSFQDARQRNTDWDGLAHEQILLFQSGATEDLGLWFLENAKGMIGGVTYNADIFRADTARMMHDRYLDLLARVIAEPHRSIAALAQCGESELAQLRNWNTASAPAEAAARIDMLFEAQAERVPSAIALVSGKWGTSYLDLERKANRISTCLRQRGVDKGSVVALAGDPGVSRVAGLLGILKTGGVCVLLDPADPPSRLKVCLADSGASVIVGESKLAALLNWPRERALWFDVDIAEITAAPDARVARSESNPDQGAIVTYGASASDVLYARALTHHAIVRILDAVSNALDLSSGYRVLGIAGLDSAAWVLELLLPLLHGGESVVTERHEVSSGESLFKRLVSSKANVVLASADTWQRMLTEKAVDKIPLKAVCAGGLLKPQLGEAILARHGALWNAMLTDADVFASLGEVKATAESIHAGLPLAGSQVWVLDERGEAAPLGAIGEICVCGDAAGLPFGERVPLAGASTLVEAPWVAPGARLCRTGSRGRWLASGHIEELGRLDRRLRIAGRAIDPAAVEAALRDLPGVARAVVAVRDDHESVAQMIGYLARKPDSQPDEASLLAALASRLPAAAIPQHLVVADQLPALMNGKIDVAALPITYRSEPAVAPVEQEPLPDKLEQALSEMWSDLLGIRSIGANDDFFDLGGDSLLAVRLFQRAQKLTGVNLPLASLLTAPTIARQAAAFRAAGAKEPTAIPTTREARRSAADDHWSPLVPIQPNGSRPPLFCIHAVGGNVLNYVPLAKALDADQPLYGVQARGLDGITLPVESITSMATSYIAGICALQPHGPYFLAGGSMGGMIAYEIAHQLREQGETIGLLALFDTYGPANRQFEVDREKQQRAVFGEAWQRRLQRAKGLDARGRVMMLLHAFGWRASRLGDMARVRWFRMLRKPLPHALRYREVERVHEYAHLAYRAPPSDIPLTLLRASEQCGGITYTRTLGWEEIVNGDIEVIEVPGDHDTLIEQPALTERLREVLSRTQASAAAVTRE